MFCWSFDHSTCGRFHAIVGWILNSKHHQHVNLFRIGKHISLVTHVIGHKKNTARKASTWPPERKEHRVKVCDRHPVMQQQPRFRPCTSTMLSHLPPKNASGTSLDLQVACVWVWLSLFCQTYVSHSVMQQHPSFRPWQPPPSKEFAACI